MGSTYLNQSKLISIRKKNIHFKEGFGGKQTLNCILSIKKIM